MKASQQEAPNEYKLARSYNDLLKGMSKHSKLPICLPLRKLDNSLTDRIIQKKVSQKQTL